MKYFFADALFCAAYVIALFLGVFYFGMAAAAVLLFGVLALNLIYKAEMRHGAEEMGREFVEYDKWKEEASRKRALAARIDKIIVAAIADVKKLRCYFHFPREIYVAE